MTRPPDQSGEDAAGILRAIGSLLVALSGNVDNPEIDRTVDEVLKREDRRPPSPDPAPRPRSGRSASVASDYVPSPELVREVDFILSDARERARQILDESTERAESLLRPDLRSVPGIDPRAFEDLRQATRNLTTEIRDVQRRLSRIEALLRASSVVRTRMEAGLPLGDPDDDYSSHDPAFGSARIEDAPPPSAPPAPPRERRAFVAPEPRPAPATPEPERTPEPEPTPEPFAPPPIEDADDPIADFDDDDESFVSPPDAAIPPRGRDGSTVPPPPADLPASAVPHVRTPTPEPEEPASEAEEAWAGQSPAEAVRSSPRETSDANLESAPATLHPEDGAIVLRVSPVSGFQGLMRVHDAIMRLAVVGQASVEAYSQGEARLRVELIEEVHPDDLVRELGRTLQEPTSIRGALPERRELFVTLQ